MTTACKHERGTATRGRASVGMQSIPSLARYTMSLNVRDEISYIRESASTYAVGINNVGKLYQQPIGTVLLSGCLDTSYLKKLAVSPLVVHDSLPLAKLVIKNPVDAQGKIKIMTPDNELLTQSGLSPEEIQSIDAIAESILTQFGVTVEQSKIWLDVWTEAEPTVNKELYIRDANVATIVDMEWAFTRALVEADTPVTRTNKYLIHFMPSAE